MIQKIILDELVKSRQRGRHSKKLQMQGAQILRNEAYIEVRRNDERRSATRQMDFLRSRQSFLRHILHKEAVL
jgi:hypothetical protein